MHLTGKGNFDLAPHLDWRGRASDLRQPGHVYYARSEDTGRIKIGWSSNVANRLATLQRSSGAALTIIWSEPGTGRDERNLHAKFAAARLHGEWFSPVPELLAHIETRRQTTAPPVALERGFTKPPAPVRTKQESRAVLEMQREFEALPDNYWDFGQPGWDRLVAASKALA